MQQTMMGERKLHIRPWYIMPKGRAEETKRSTSQNQDNISLRREQFGNRGKIAVTKELKQFNTFEPKCANKLTNKDKKKALASLIFIKEKQNGDVKACTCANGGMQREHIAKEEAAMTTVALESNFPSFGLSQNMKFLQKS